MQERVSMIITLAHKIGGSEPWYADCYQYFPQSESEEFKISSCTIKCVELKETQFLNSRKLKVIGNDGSERDVTHLHFTGWPDWETPHDESLEVFKSLINTGADFVKAQNEKAG